MWDCAGGADSGTVNQRGIYLLIGSILFCVFIYKAWGPLLIITLALIVVVHTCYSLLVNDSLLTPYTLVLLGHARQIAWELLLTVRSLSVQGVRKLKELLRYLRNHYDDWTGRQAVGTFSAANTAEIDEEMNGRQRRTYSLSTTGNELVNQVSPIVKDPYRTFALNGANDAARTSTPLPRGSPWKKNVQPNGDLGLFTPSGSPSTRKQSPSRSENRLSSPSQLRNDDTMYGPKGSPWAGSNTPKLRERHPGMKTVQTVAGPLLASTRYNIDPKVYTDVSSPGLTSRLTKYATEASNKLTHQPQYAAGQFPKVNLHASPTPLLSPSVARARMPVTVRVAPPEIVNYTSADAHQERTKMSPNSSPQDLKETKSFPSVSKTLKKLPLKRHTSREDIMIDLAKKQRFERIFDGELENLEEMMQKRAREESIASDEDGSPQSKNERPLKRSKASSCHDVINSLSSSINVYTGVKRKAMDTSRCNTPCIEKHFKLSTTSPSRSSSLSLLTSGELARSREQLNVNVPVVNTIKETSPEKPKEKSPEVTKPDGFTPEKPKSPVANTLNLPTPKIRKEIPISDAIKSATKLADKLFMRAEPQANEKIKTMIDEQGKVEAKFTTDEKEEIKKEDIVNMRQNSMRLRLQSMFDAISGKSSKIDPDVVIQAEEVNPPSTSAYTSLSIMTSTTTVNTSPIATTIVPILKTDTETKSPANKHVTFNIPSASSQLSVSSNASTLSNAEITKPAETKLPTSVPNFNFGATTSSAPSLNFGSNAPASASTAPTSTTTSSFSFPASSIAAPIVSSKSETNVSNTTTSTSSSTSLFSAKPTATSTVTTSSTGFSFGAATTATKTPTVTSSAASAPSFSIPSSVSKTTEMNLGGNIAAPMFGNALAKSPASLSLAQTTTTSIPSFGGEKKEQGFSFGAPSSTSGISTSTNTSQPPSLFGSTTTSSPMFSAGSNNPPPAYSAPSTTASTSSAPAATSMFSFGGASKQPSNFSFGASTAPATTNATSTAIPTFGSGTATMTGFGTPAASNPTATTSAPTFGATSTPSLFGGQTSAPSLFSGGSSSITTTTSASPMFKSPSATTAFGAPQPTTTTSATTSIFGAPSATPSFGASSAATASTPSLFGNTSASTPSTNLFGSASAATTTTPSAFGASQQPQQQQSSIFSGASNTTSSTASIFGSATSPASSGGLFSGTSAASQPSATNPADAGNIFGQAKLPTTVSFGGSTSAFGSVAPTSSFSSPNVTSPSTFQIGSAPSTSSSLPSFSTIKPTPQFGAPSGTQPSASNSGTSIFGSTSSGNTFGANPTPAFGSTSNAAPTFGSSTNAAPPFGSSTNATPTFGSGSNTTPTFGSTGSTTNAVPAFGSTGSATNSASTFGSTASTNNATSTFGSSGSTTSAFGMPSAGSSTSAFGASSTPSFGSTGNTTSPFGAPQPATTTAPSLFGSAAATGPSTSGSGTNSTFNFGSSQPAQPATAQPAAGSFAFGSAPAAAPGGSQGVFQFGSSSTAPKPAGFNFNAPTSAPQINFSGGNNTATSFNAPAPGAPNFQPPGANMFSIGSGSSTPRSRTGRSRRQR